MTDPKQVRFARPSQERFKGQRLKWETGFLEVLPGCTVLAVIINPLVDWWEMHWYLGRHFPCTRPMGYCHACRTLPTSLHGYIAVANQVDNKVRVLHLTKRMWDECPELHHLDQLRGAQLRLTRPHAHQRGKTFVKLDGWQDADGLPKPFPIEPWFLKVYGEDAQKLIEGEEVGK